MQHSTLLGHALSSVDLTQWDVKTGLNRLEAPSIRGAVKGQRPLNATAASLLGFLHDGPLSGWDLVTTAQRLIGDFWSLTQSQVYRELSAMADDGLVKTGKPGPRDRKPYVITSAGRRAFSGWLSREPAPETIRFPLLLTVAFGRHLPPEQLATFLVQHRNAHAERLAGYQAQRAQAEAATNVRPDPYLAATLDFGLTYERAVLDWFDRLPHTLTAPGKKDTQPETT
jgi:DNA-binding PadR family transcriptional regulator